jgi:hypothetical protein
MPARHAHLRTQIQCSKLVTARGTKLDPHHGQWHLCGQIPDRKLKPDRFPVQKTVHQRYSAQLLQISLNYA